MSVTINEVARRAGVSRATVSLVLRGSQRVAEDTRARVNAAIDQLGYRPSHFAAGLRSRRSHIVGLVVSQLTFPHHAQIALGLEEAIEGAGYSVLAANSRGQLEREQDHIERLRRYHADGLVITPLEVGPDAATHLSALRADGYPLVTAYREIPGLAVDFVGVDVRESVQQAVAHLMDLGHQRIALLAGSGGNPVWERRVAGWRDALLSRGVQPDDALVARSTAGAYAGEAAIQWLMAQHIAFSAVVATNDFLALSAMRALYRAGLHVPEDVSVVGMGGFDDVMSPEKPLTTVAHDFQGIGRLAGELLLRRIERPFESDAERHIVPADLRMGQTTAPPKIA